MQAKVQIGTFPSTRPPLLGISVPMLAQNACMGWRYGVSWTDVAQHLVGGFEHASAALGSATQAWNSDQMICLSRRMIAPAESGQQEV
jgi:hypothetical protein